MKRGRSKKLARFMEFFNKVKEKDHEKRYYKAEELHTQEHGDTAYLRYETFQVAQKMFREDGMPYEGNASRRY